MKGHEDCGSQLPMFQTRSGKSVLVSESSVQKARAVLEEEGDVNTKQSYLLYSMHMKLLLIYLNSFAEYLRHNLVSLSKMKT